MTRRTSSVAACNSCASFSSWVNRTTAVSWPEAEELLWRTAFRALALRLRALVSLLLVLERRRIAHPKAEDYADFQSSITAGICDGRNGVQRSVCTAAIPSRSCPLWVKSGQWGTSDQCPLYPQKQT